MNVQGGILCIASDREATLPVYSLDGRVCRNLFVKKGQNRFIATSMDGEAIPGNGGTLFSVTLLADVSLAERAGTGSFGEVVRRGPRTALEPPAPTMAGTVTNIEFNTQDNQKFSARLWTTKNHFPELTIPIKDEWLSSPLPKQSFFVTHIVSAFNVDDVLARHNCFSRQPFFDNVVDKIVANIIDGAWECYILPSLKTTSKKNRILRIN